MNPYLLTIYSKACEIIAAFVFGFLFELIALFYNLVNIEKSLD